MPILGGRETTAKIRAIFKYSILAIITMTEHDFDFVRDYCLTLGMNGHISKPIDRLILHPMLKFIFQKSGRIQP
jgi:CheY-like chemotaxis protein